MWQFCDTCNGTETGDYYFVYNSTNYQFTMPTIQSGAVIYFNTDTLKLYLENTEITTEEASTGTLLAMSNTPNPNFLQAVQVVEGSNSVKFKNKNLYEPFSYTHSSSNMTFTHNTDGRIEVSGTAPSNGASSIQLSTVESNNYFITLFPGTYTLSGGTGNANIRLQLMAGGSSIISLSNRLYGSVTLTEVTKVWLRIYVIGGTAVEKPITI